MRSVWWRLVVVVVVVVVVCGGMMTSAQKTQPPPDVTDYEDDFPYDPCEEDWRSSCQHRQDKTYGPYNNCHCDHPLCQFYSDCCHDASNYSSPAGGDIQGSLTQFPTTCEAEFFEYPINIVQDCPVEFQDEGIIQKCKVNGTLSGSNMDEILSFVPVTDTETGVVFRNVFCAACHGLTEVKYWTAGVMCNSESDVDYENKETPADQVASLDDCEVRFEFTPNGTPRLCYEDFVGECPENFSEPGINTLCLNHTAYRYQRTGRVFRNEYCAVCHNVSLDTLFCDADPTHGRSLEVPYQPPTYRVLMDFNVGKGYGSYGQVMVKNRTCDVGYKYDVFSAKCRFLFCPDGHKLHDGSCLPEASSLASTDRSQTCPLIRLNASEVVFGSNGSLYISAADLTLNKTAYTMQEDGSGILICSYLLDHGKQTNSWRNTGDDRVQWVLSLVGVLLSILALIALITVYGCFACLQNTPGKCLLALSSSLLSGQLMFLLSTSLLAYRAACMFIGTLMHFSFLCSFFWMNVLAFDIWRTFTRQYQRAPKAKGNGRFIRHSLYAFGVPLVIVSVCLVLDLVDSDKGFSPQYGSHICWISNKYVLIAAFAVPLACVILTNAVFFSMSVYHIHQASRSAKICEQPTQDGSSSSSNTKRQLVLYVKLSTIMGLTWLFGFVANFTAVAEVFWYLFIICNSLQGVFIALGFLCNKTVYRLVNNAVKSRFGMEADVSGKTESTSKRTTLAYSITA